MLLLKDFAVVYVSKVDQAQEVKFILHADDVSGVLYATICEEPDVTWITAYKLNFQECYGTTLEPIL